MDPLFLQLFLILNVFVIGVLATLGVQHARAHFRPRPAHESHDVLPAEIKTKLLRAAEADFGNAIQTATDELRNSLAATTTQMNTMVEKMVTYIVNDEMEQYRKSLDELYRQNEATLKASLTDTTGQHVELKTKLLRRQAELDAALVEYQTTLEQHLLKHQTESEAHIQERQTALLAEIKAQQTKRLAEQNDYDQKLKSHQAELEAKLSEHQTQLMARLNERATKLADYQTALEADLTERQAAQAALQTTFEATLSKEMEAKKAFLTRQIETRLSDAVTTLLVESLGQNIDLGAQTAYLTATLESHKDELIQGVRDEL